MHADNRKNVSYRENKFRKKETDKRLTKAGAKKKRQDLPLYIRCI